MPVEQLLVLALFVLAALAQLLYARFRRGRGDEAAGTNRSGARDRIPGPSAEPAPIPGRPPGPRTDRARGPRPTPAAPAGTRPIMRSRLGTLQDVRRGIVLMTVLGPCRALEAAPPNPRSPERGTPHEGDR